MNSINTTIIAKYVDSISTKSTSANFIHSYFNNRFHQGCTCPERESYSSSKARAKRDPKESNQAKERVGTYKVDEGSQSKYVVRSHHCTTIPIRKNSDYLSQVSQRDANLTITKIDLNSRTQFRSQQGIISLKYIGACCHLIRMMQQFETNGFVTFSILILTLFTVKLPLLTARLRPIRI
ncbi:unnamed protein product [Trichogramma brassicae]|uniref:Uncharacterized protein n=1 Tax=Trichogramma brassicae TaxID=86971 RepID=A0A6H5IFN8_9HYME|nr:unnamed protein product [Trichogramma brassicae]